MAKRVSLKGRGADIFFGDYAPPSDTVGPVPEGVLPEVAQPPEEHRALADPTTGTAAGASESERPARTASARGRGQQHQPTDSKLASKHTSLQASKHANMHASLQRQRGEVEADQATPSVSASKLASLQASTEFEQRDWGRPGDDLAEAGTDAGEDASAPFAEGPSDGLGDLGGEIWARVDAAATITSSFRYTESELTALTDVLYDVSKQYSARVTKQDVARLALNAVLSDYYQHGPSSLLGKLAARRRRHTGGR